MNHEENYFFISYNHRNDAVYQDVEYFNKSYVNYWIDNDGMKGSDDSWLERAKIAINDPKCVGAVFYLCENALKSAAVEKEIDAVSARRSENSAFFVIAVLVGGRSIPHLIKKVYDSVDDSLLNKTLPVSRIAKIAGMFPSDKIYILRNELDLDAYYEKLLGNLRDFDVILDGDYLKDKLKAEKKLDSYERYSYGRFYNEETVSGVYLTSINVFEELNDNLYIKLSDGNVHTAGPIKWIVLEASEGKMKLITESVLEKIPGKDIDRWLNNDFINLAFTDEEKSRIHGAVKTLNREEYDLYTKNNVGINPNDGKYWINSINSRGQQNMLMLVSGGKLNEIGLRKDLKCGIRPVVEITV